MTTWILTYRLDAEHAEMPLMTSVGDTAFFTDFATARATFRQWLGRYALSPSPWFDGEGRLTDLERYILHEAQVDVDEPYEEFRDNGWLTVRRLRSLQAALAAVCHGEDVDVPLEEGDYSDSKVELKVTADAVCLQGWSDAPYCGYNLAVRTNAFNMTQEGEYYFELGEPERRMRATPGLSIRLRRM